MFAGEAEVTGVYRLDLEAGWADAYVPVDGSRSDLLTENGKIVLQRYPSAGLSLLDLHPEWGEVAHAEEYESLLPTDSVFRTGEAVAPWAKDTAEDG